MWSDAPRHSWDPLPEQTLLSLPLGRWLQCSVQVWAHGYWLWWCWSLLQSPSVSSWLCSAGWGGHSEEGTRRHSGQGGGQTRWGRQKEQWWKRELDQGREREWEWSGCLHDILDHCEYALKCPCCNGLSYKQLSIRTWFWQLILCHKYYLSTKDYVYEHLVTN